MYFGLATLGLPVALTALVLWLLVARWTGFAWKRTGLCVVLGLCWGYFALIRIENMNADLGATVAWRWQPTAADLFNAWRASQPPAPAPKSEGPLTLSEGDWPSFRGPDRDGVIPGVTIATDWDKTPPKQLWRNRVGAGWSSVIVIGERLFTQEQRDEGEAVVCYNAVTGREIWVHTDPPHFKDTVSGFGPRATPTFADGQLFTMGATGLVNCLDAVTGKRHWSHDIAAEAGVRPPMWGFSSSPLVVGDKVIVFAGGDSGRGLLAYRTDKGDLAWGAPASSGSYSSPQLVTLCDRRQCLLLGDSGLTAVDPDTGKSLWQFGWDAPGAPRALQPHVVGTNRLAAGTLTGAGVSLAEVKQEGQEWKVTEVWSANRMKPEFSDFVVHKGHAYGFDAATFCCLDLANGKRLWRQGRYGRGQVMLLPEQGLLLVMTEPGEVVLLAADPERSRELGRLAVLVQEERTAYTWNHPVIAHGRLYVRNAEEMACYELPGFERKK
jgi:outer membrane protein assembly factor BamB